MPAENVCDVPSVGTPIMFRLIGGEVPAVQVPNPHVWSWRELIICRRKLVEKRTVAKLAETLGGRGNNREKFTVR